MAIAEQTVTIKIKADTSELESAIAKIKPSDYEIRLTAIDFALRREGILGGGLDIIKTAHRFERYLRGEDAE